jgi:hypothetical protein
MKKLIAACAVVSLAGGLPAVATAGSGGSDRGGPRHGGSDKRSKVYKARIRPVVYGADQAYSGIEGKAQVLDTKRQDKIWISMRGLRPGVTYPWHIHVIPNAAAGTNPCRANAPQGAIVTAFTYGPLRAGRSGRADAMGTASSYTFLRSALYYVNVHDPRTGAPISCGILDTKRKPYDLRPGKDDDRGHDDPYDIPGKDDRGGHKGDRADDDYQGDRPRKDSGGNKGGQADDDYQGDRPRKDRGGHRGSRPGSKDHGSRKRGKDRGRHKSRKRGKGCGKQNGNKRPKYEIRKRGDKRAEYKLRKHGKRCGGSKGHKRGKNRAR